MRKISTSVEISLPSRYSDGEAIPPLRCRVITGFRGLPAKSLSPLKVGFSAPVRNVEQHCPREDHEPENPRSPLAGVKAKRCPRKRVHSRVQAECRDANHPQSAGRYDPPVDVSTGCTSPDPFPQAMHVPNHADPIPILETPTEARFLRLLLDLELYPSCEALGVTGSPSIGAEDSGRTEAENFNALLKESGDRLP